MQDYRIKLSYNYGSSQYREQYTNAIFGDDLSLDYDKGSGEEYFREKLSGKITFTGSDYDFIMSAVSTSLDTKIGFLMEIYEHNSWWYYLSGYFYGTDCEINVDDKIIVVEPTTDDRYEQFLGGIEKEFDLIELAPAISPVIIDKRPCLQIYAFGNNSISCYLSNMHWEQACEVVESDPQLQNTYKFALWCNAVSVRVSGTHTPNIPTSFVEKIHTHQYDIQITSGNYKLRAFYYPSDHEWMVGILDSSNTLLFSKIETVDVLSFPRSITLEAVSGSGATGTCVLDFELQAFYARLVSDVDSILGVDTFPLPSQDICPINRNYSRVSPVSNNTGDLLFGMSLNHSSQPTKWGIYQPGEYYSPPFVIGGGEFMPVAPNLWGYTSYWISQSSALDYVEQTARHSIVFKDAYRLWIVIQSLLTAMGSGLTLQSTFLGGGDPLGEEGDIDDGILYITPKSNILSMYYTEPAQKAPITLKQILDMLRKVYRCYWTIRYGYLVIEHIEYFRRGGRYNGTPGVEVDLTAKTTVRNGKFWSYLTNKYTYDKPDMPARYEFGWMDNVTEPFNGWPIDMLSGYVDESKVEKISVSNFTSDIDYLMLNPDDASRDGFAIMKADSVNLISEPVSVGGQNSIAVVLEYEPSGSESVFVEYENTGPVDVYAFDRLGNNLGRIGGSAFDGDWSATWTLPAGTAVIAVRFGNTASTFILKTVEPPTLKVVYTNWNYNGYTDHWLQNGRLSFIYLSRYYAYDMPCKNYRIGTGEYAETKIAKGTSKKKTQEITFPTLSTSSATVDINKIIKTGLGDGKIRKISVNLSSKIAKGTLEYDTE